MQVHVHLKADGITFYLILAPNYLYHKILPIASSYLFAFLLFSYNIACCRYQVDIIYKIKIVKGVLKYAKINMLAFLYVFESRMYFLFVDIFEM